jgi:rhomboid protease GluP
MNSAATVNEKDQMLMQLVHYFITVQNYTPIVVKGVQNEIWLENLEAPYRIIRINSNYIHNNEQLDFDMFKIKNVVKQVKRKTLSFNIKTLNILINVGSSVEIQNTDKIDCIAIDSSKGLKSSKEINSLYPDLKKNLLDTEDGIEFLINVTNDINQKTEAENREFEKVFKPKNAYVTKILIALNVLVYILGIVGTLTGKFDLYTRFALHRNYVQAGEIYRLITSSFTHENIFHLLMNMYALYVIGSQVESYIGKKKYLAIYLFSALTGSLLSCLINTGWSLGASDAIFGLMGALLYFGYHYRLYLDNALRTQIIPLIGLNLILGFLIPNIDNAAHIGGLVGGIFITMALGVNNKSSKSDRINGAICSILLVLFLAFVLFN